MYIFVQKPIFPGNVISTEHKAYHYAYFHILLFFKTNININFMVLKMFHIENKSTIYFFEHLQVL